MDTNLSRAYYSFSKNKRKYPRFRYFRYNGRRQDDLRTDHGGSSMAGKSDRSDQKRRARANTIIEEPEDEICLQSSPLSRSIRSNVSSDGQDFKMDHNQHHSDLRLLDEPEDRFHAIYLGFMLAGVGFLLPYNSFVTAVDFFQDRYPGTTIIFDMSCVYIIFAFIAVTINNILIETISLFWRINIGYIISLVTLILIAIFEIATSAFSQSVAYDLNLMAVAIVAFGCTLQQSSFYGYTSMLPKKYTHAVMTGESAAGLIVSINRILTKLMLPEEQINTLLFFSLSIVLIAICIVIHNALQRTNFVKFHIERCSRRSTHYNSKILRNLHKSETTRDSSCQGLEDITLVDYLESDYRTGPADNNFVPLDSPCIRDDVSNKFFSHSDSTEFDMPFGIDDEELQNYVPPMLPESSSSNRTKTSLLLSKRRESIEDEALLSQSNETSEAFSSISNGQIFGQQGCSSEIQLRSTSIRFVPRKSSILELIDFFRSLFSSYRSRFLDGFRMRMDIVERCWPYMVAIAMAYFVTLSLFPGIESEIINCQLGSWMPVLLMAIFNAFDFVGKITASLFYDISSTQLIGLSILRILIIPLLALCAAPRGQPFFGHIVWPFFFSSMLGLSNGIIGSLPMILAPIHSPNESREHTGNLMTFSYSLGLLSGSFFSYIVEYSLGPSQSDQEIACNANSTMHNTTSSS
ncbi:equilibrative nucleoside transporter 3 [Brevipalpus obovatus]|uniref:equilibrative nucleoside transporter 3 n=1 Tax=Brevipalpus obovatus TaxID=246614 RepID=UPI003D9E28FC